MFIFQKMDKETFIDTINFIEVMAKKEKVEKECLMLKKILMLTSLFFTDSKEAKAEIEHYCFNLNFGKPTPDSEYITPGELYETLI
jgi:hypothetical protein